MSAFDNATLMITGGTGSFGSTVLKHFLDSDLKEIRIFSRDEKKQDDMRHELQAKHPEHAKKVKFYIGDVRNPQSVQGCHARCGLHLPRRRLQAGALLRVLPHGSRAHQCHGYGQRPPRRHRRRGEARGLPVHGQGGLPHQRHGHLQGHDGARDLRQRPRSGRARRHGHRLHALRQRHVLPRLA